MLDAGCGLGDFSRRRPSHTMRLRLRSTMSAQRRPGLQPGDTMSFAESRARVAATAQRRPGLQPGDTPPTRTSPQRAGALNEGRDSNPATPVTSRKVV